MHIEGYQTGCRCWWSATSSKIWCNGKGFGPNARRSEPPTGAKRCHILLPIIKSNVLFLNNFQSTKKILCWYLRLLLLLSFCLFFLSSLIPILHIFILLSRPEVWIPYGSIWIFKQAFLCVRSGELCEMHYMREGITVFPQGITVFPATAFKWCDVQSCSGQWREKYFVNPVFWKSPENMLQVEKD